MNWRLLSLVVSLCVTCRNSHIDFHRFHSVMFSHQLICGQLGLSSPVRIQALISIISFINNAVIECIHFWCLSCCLLKVRLACSPATTADAQDLLTCCSFISYSKEITLSRNSGNQACTSVFPFKKAMCIFLSLISSALSTEQCVLYPETPGENLRSESIP